MGLYLKVQLRHSDARPVCATANGRVVSANAEIRPCDSQGRLPFFTRPEFGTCGQAGPGHGLVGEAWVPVRLVAVPARIEEIIDVASCRG